MQSKVGNVGDIIGIGVVFYNLFKKETGFSPIKYLNEYRLSVAARLNITEKEYILRNNTCLYAFC